MEIVPGSGITDLGGEEPDGGGFCPVEFFVPECRKYECQENSGPGERIADWADPLKSLPVGCEFHKELQTHKGTAKLRGADGCYIEQERTFTAGGVEQVHKVPVWGQQKD